MTKRVVATAAGGPEVLEVVEESDRHPGPDEVLIEVRAAGVNPVDYKRYAGEANHDFLRALGAEPVTYGAGLLDRVRALAPDGVDAAVDAAGTPEALEVSLALVTLATRCTTIVASKAAFDAGIHVLGGAPGADPGTEIRNAARLELVDRVANGTLEVVVAATYPLAAAADAHREVMRGHVRGKVVLVP